MLDDNQIIPYPQGSFCSRFNDLAWFADVFFAYPLRPEALVLKGINLHLKRSTVTAVVGSSGAGKSTIVQLLARFYEVLLFVKLS